MTRRLKDTASRVSPKFCTGFVSPRTRAPAGTSTYRPSCEYTAFVTRQLTGAALLPSSRLVSTASITVPSSTGWNGPVDLIGGVVAGRNGDARGMAGDEGPSPPRPEGARGSAAIPGGERGGGHPLLPP